MFTLLDLKKIVRGDVWPQGEARTLRPGHDRAVVDALVDIQTAVECFQYDNTKIVPHCATFFNCGLTVFDAPRGRINRLTVIDKINPDTGLEDDTQPDNYCSEIKYYQVNGCHITAWLAQHRKSNCCATFSEFFAIPIGCCGNKNRVPVPTDEDLPPGLPLLKLGYHYPQANTDANNRAKYGVWAIERGRLYIAPYLQHTESAVLYWDGIKREWADSDLLINDPKLIEAVKYYVEMEDLRRYRQKYTEAAQVERRYNLKIQELIYECNQETRQRKCEETHAKASSSVVTLYYNDAQQFTATCPPDKQGTAKTFTVPADTISSTISKTDANQKAYQEAQTQANALLVCGDIPVTYFNTEQSFTAACTVTEGAPLPEGSSVNITIPAGQYSSTVSQAAANALALAAATEQANSQLVCVYWNAAQEFTANCAVTESVAEHTYSSTISQADADEQALNAAKAAAEVQCPESFNSTAQVVEYKSLCPNGPSIPAPGTGVLLPTTCEINVTVNVAANYSTSVVSQADANQQAKNAGLARAQAIAAQKCFQHLCGNFTDNLG